ncbi:MAG: hypothetical protein AAF460_05660 [Pseudomonadota bacterium]
MSAYSPRRTGSRLAALGAVLCLVGCATPVFDQARALHHGGDSAGALVALESAEADVPERDRLVYLLERGTLELHSNAFDAAARSFVAAVDYIDEQDRISLRDEARALLTSEATTRYTGESSERLLAHSYAMLSFLLAGNAESAAVEARRATQRLQAGDDELAAANVTRALIALSFEMAGQTNDAYVAARSLPADTLPATTTRLARRLGSSEARQPVPVDLEAAHADARGELILVVSSGQVSRKFSSHLHNGIDWQIAFPAYPSYRPSPAATRIAFDTDALPPAETARSDIDGLARASLDARAGRLLLRQGMRLAAKSRVADELRNSDDLATQLLAFAILVSEVADTRGWYALPARLELWRVPVPPAATTLTVSAGAASQVIDLGALRFNAGPRIRLLRF